MTANKVWLFVKARRCRGSNSASWKIPARRGAAVRFTLDDGHVQKGIRARRDSGTMKASAIDKRSQ